MFGVIFSYILTRWFPDDLNSQEQGGYFYFIQLSWSYGTTPAWRCRKREEDCSFALLTFKPLSWQILRCRNVSSTTKWRLRPDCVPFHGGGVDKGTAGLRQTAQLHLRSASERLSSIENQNDSRSADLQKTLLPSSQSKQSEPTASLLILFPDKRRLDMTILELSLLSPSHLSALEQDTQPWPAQSTKSLQTNASYYSWNPVILFFPPLINLKLWFAWDCCGGQVVPSFTPPAHFKRG